MTRNPSRLLARALRHWASIRLTVHTVALTTGASPDQQVGNDVDRGRGIRTDGGIAANDLDDITRLAAGDVIMLDGHREEFTVVKPVYAPNGPAKIGVQVIDQDMCEYEVRIIDVDDRYLVLCPDADDAPVRALAPQRIQDFAVVGHEIERVERWQQQLLQEQA